MRSMWMWLALAALVAPGVHAKTDEAPAPRLEETLATVVEGTITIGPDGRTKSHVIESSVSDVLRAKLGTLIQGWEFEPVLIKGSPVTAQAKMRLSLVASELNADDLMVSVDNVTFHDAPGAVADDTAKPVETKTRRMAPPDYPADAARSGLMSTVLLYVRLSPEGKVVNSAVVQSSLSNAQGRSDSQRASTLARFEKSALRASRNWSFDVQVNDPNASAEDFTRSVPVVYTLGAAPTSPTPGKWRSEFRTPRRAIPWLPQAVAQSPGVGDVIGSAPMPLAGTLRLKTAVAGTSL